MLSLIEDQVMQLRSLNIKAEMFSASLQFKEVSKIYEVISYSFYRVCVEVFNI